MEHDIHVLDQATVDKIAAGEVVERPASVVKELTENAIDAGADRITIEIKDGGISSIRITDNGRGIAADDIPLAFLRHATSKITTVQDLLSLNSLGFRGEALSSIAAVARVELITKRPEDLSASRYCIEGGRETLREEIGAPDGTTIIVRDLFFNTPARAKFLKSAVTEASHIGTYVEQLMLSNPSIAFQFLVNGQMKLSSPGNGNLKDAVYHVYGKEIVSELVEVRQESDGIQIHGFIAKPVVSRGNRNYENYYVNGRYVKSKVIYRGVEDGFSHRLMQHQYPFTCLFLDISGSTVDVNVHPSKMEVRFSDEKAVYDAVVRCVDSALSGLEMVVSSSLNPVEKTPQQALKEETKHVKKLAPFEQNAVRQAVEHTQAEQNEQKTLSAKKVREQSGYQIHPETGEVTAAPDAGQASDKQPVYEQQSFLPQFLSEEARPLRKVIGQVFHTYWIFEYEEQMYIMDQHAAHEKVLFERFMKQYHNRKLSSQRLSPAMVLSLDSRERSLLDQYGDAFEALGFDIEPFGGKEIAIHAVPYELGKIDSEELFLSMLADLEVSRNLEDLDIYVHRVATEACKAAVKGGGRISVEEAQSLVDQLFECEDPYHCPHGRPTIISISKTDLEKRFKRIV